MRDVKSKNCETDKERSVTESGRVKKRKLKTKGRNEKAKKIAFHIL
jgi:hypothetical protein